MAERNPESLAARVTVQEFTEMTFASVMRAATAHKFPVGHIIYGIVLSPQTIQNISAPAERET